MTKIVCRKYYILQDILNFGVSATLCSALTSLEGEGGVDAVSGSVVMADWIQMSDVVRSQLM